MNLTLRMAVPADAPAMAAIYAPYVRGTSISFEYEPPSPEEFTRRVEAILPHTMSGPLSSGMQSYPSM